MYFRTNTGTGTILLCFIKFYVLGISVAEPEHVERQHFAGARAETFERLQLCRFIKMLSTKNLKFFILKI
jgi:hypothetical protein